MMKAQLQFQFPEPGNWGKFILTAVFPDKNGFIQSRRFTQDDIPGAQAETFHEVVTRVAVLSDEWKALQVRAQLDQVIVNLLPEEAEVSPESKDAVVLTVEAVNARGGRRLFTSQDYSEFTMMDEAAVAFFNYFITNTSNQ
ncbi:hypothetical protein [Akkermansia muciniphila]|uniref:hypothetical protein n=1 Tax=Akkermansia muciniphila TaxID=239935 RepID=UPI001BFFD2A6|nr:hypothetical protein [Akkermansia muciniphila]MBT8777934.1 hypothetical protein [Akkermansia muciniphila]